MKFITLVSNLKEISPEEKKRIYKKLHAILLSKYDLAVKGY